MAWIEQTKKGSRKSGGPQYYLQDITAPTRAFLAQSRRCEVHLWTPYGVLRSGLIAVSSKEGRVGHDRVQSGGKVPSIADQIAYWYSLDQTDLEQIEFEDSFDRDAMLIRPSRVKFFSKERRRILEHDSHPLSLVAGHRSNLVTRHLRDAQYVQKTCLRWVCSQVSSIVTDHGRKAKDVDERDLLRTSGALSKLGISLGMYRAKGLDCPDAAFSFCGLPQYRCPIEVEERSSGFNAPHHIKEKHHEQRVVLLCMQHDAPELLRPNVDVLELRELDRLLREVA